MESIKRWGAVSVLSASLIGAPAWAAEPAHADELALRRDPHITLGAAVDAAWQRYPDATLAAARAQEAEALTRRGNSLIGADPALYLRHESDAAGSDTGLAEWEGGIELPLWRWGERSASRRVGDEARRDAQATAALLRLEVAGEVREAAWEAVLMENALALAQAELATARELEAQVERRVSRGELARADLLLARDQTLQSAARLQEAELSYRHAVLAYRRLTGLEALPEPLLETPVSAEPQANPYLAAPSARLARSQAQLEQTRQASGGKPVLFLGGKSTDDGSGNTVDSLQASITFPLGSSHSGTRRAEAALAVAESQAALARAHRALERMQHEAEHELEAARRSLSLAEERAALAEESGRLAKRGFDLGELSLAEYLRERSRTLAATREAAQRRIELGRQVARYNQALGVAP